MDNLNGPGPKDKVRDLLDPNGLLHRRLREVIQFAWLYLVPPEHKTIDELEKQVRLLVDRALEDMRHQPKYFGLDKF